MLVVEKIGKIEKIDMIDMIDPFDYFIIESILSGLNRAKNVY